jgi:alkanesulfonate monooxygenase SsuD/methylene tetrahydromethanopterin reductase-like flavin-dependent oxidoreductase (luciferase family)
MELGLLTLGDHRADPTTGVRTTQEEKHREILDYIDFAEPAGFDAVFVGEHHFSDFIVSSPHVFLSWLAGRTSKIRLGTGVSLLPHHDPVRLAEDFATLDVVSGGRAEVWCGKGVEPQVYEQFGQDVGRVLEMQQEGLELLVKLWTERNVTWSGEFRPPLGNVTLEPRPVQQPHVPIYVACSSPESAAGAASMGLGVTISLLYFPRKVLPRVVDAYYEAWEDAGHRHEPKVTLNAHMHVAPTSQEARDHLGIYQFPFQRWVFSKKSGINPDDVQLPPHITELSDPEGAIINGSPEEVVDRIGRISATCRFDRLTYQGDYGGQPWPIIKRSLDLFVADVMPSLAREPERVG